MNLRRILLALLCCLSVTVQCCPVYVSGGESADASDHAAADGDISGMPGAVTGGMSGDTESIPAVSEPRQYTEDDWDKWRVDFRRIDRRPYRESDREKKIFSYIQVPVHDTGRTRWAGDWYALEEGGKLFVGFGCGICCLANIYSTFIRRPVDPGMMLNAAKNYTSYDPGGEYGAIDWPQMKLMCEKLGMTAQCRKKPADYTQFQEDVKNADATVVLVCKDDDPGLWFYTNGHYVTLWEYDPDDDTVYVTDSSGLFNRERVFLKDVYAALKTRSSYQYLCVDSDILGFHTPDQ